MSPHHLIKAALPLIMPLSMGGASMPAPSSAAVFQELCEIVRDQFVYPRLNGVDWEAARNRYAARLERTLSSFAPDESIAVQSWRDAMAGALFPSRALQHRRLWLPTPAHTAVAKIRTNAEISVRQSSCAGKYLRRS